MRLIPAAQAESSATPVSLPAFSVTIGNSEPRALCFDLENRPLAYWYDGQTTSQITAFGWKWSDEDHVDVMLLEPEGMYIHEARCNGEVVGENIYYTKDAHALFARELTKADIVYGHNIRRHDLPIFNSWLLRLQLPLLPPLLTSDTLSDYPKRNGLSASLENLAAMYGLGGDKFGMSQPMWEEANRLTPEGMKLARKRVESDVLLQERLRAKEIELGLLGPPKIWKGRR